MLESLEPHEGVPDIAAELVQVPNESDAWGAVRLGVVLGGGGEG